MADFLNVNKSFEDWERWWKRMTSSVDAELLEKDTEDKEMANIEEKADHGNGD